MSSFLITFRRLFFTLDCIYSLLSSPEDIIEINTFIQGNTMLIKNDSKDIYIIIFYLKMLFFKTYYSSLKKNSGFLQKHYFKHYYWQYAENSV